MEKIKITPDIYKKTVTIHTMCHSNKENLIMKSDVYFEGKFINSVSGKLEAGVCQMDIDVYNKYVDLFVITYKTAKTLDFTGIPAHSSNKLSAHLLSDHI